ncbi:hypothetical protein SAMN05421805_102273 [Saccharopolyspora antimicrobica]|uniref:Uncharacterized protein n=2 Tax=Saccharopolyspora antimicrobica TaxID=455193 RepID=A0A1I4VM78_9PSEU|nr:hypothetical protein ATL45_5714 [Saccharopolyspora antimicrobica]SFN02280.1 hypothetical protein SAMN05421805_102273 [Saccharopolyspora antimicrobica]
MAEQIITGLVPPPKIADSGSSPEAGTGERRSLPLPVITRRRELLTTYGMTRVDASGRIPAAPVLHALEWPPGLSLTVRVVLGAVVLQPDPGGVHRLPSTQRIKVPATARAECGLRASDVVVLVADPQRGMLLIYPLVTVDEVLAQRHAMIWVGESV